MVGEAVVLDLELEVLFHLALVDHLADRERDRRRPGERAGLDPRFDRRQRGLGRGEQVFAFARPLGRHQRVAADDKPLARVVGACDLAQVLLVEERQLQRALLDQLLHLRRLQRGNPADPLLGGERLQVGLGDHAPVDHQHERRQAEAAAELAIWAGSVLSSWTPPGKTSIATGRPSRSQSSP